jgi:hypothetical protein
MKESKAVQQHMHVKHKQIAIELDFNYSKLTSERCRHVKIPMLSIILLAVFDNIGEQN